jgi:SAM-dependent methyltransferase
MSTEVRWMPESEPLANAIGLMDRYGIGAMPVQAADGRPKGLLVKRDLGALSDPRTAGQACRPWLAIDQDAALEDAVELLEAESLGRVPVQANGKVVGGISRSQIRAYRELEQELGLNLAELVREVSPRDTMFDGRLWLYLEAGPSALRCIRRGLEAAGSTAPTSILDFGSGHGRTLRFLQIAYPQAALTACDVDGDAVEFCGRVFGVPAVQSDPDPRRVDIQGAFDLIWSASVLTHVPADRWPHFLRFFESHLSPQGVLIFTTGGAHVVSVLREGDHSYGIPDEAVERLLAQFDRESYGYVDYPNWPDYGVAVSSADWVSGQIAATSLRVVDFNERGLDDHQDVFTCVLRR